MTGAFISMIVFEIVGGFIQGMKRRPDANPIVMASAVALICVLVCLVGAGAEFLYRSLT